MISATEHGKHIKSYTQW